MGLIAVGFIRLSVERVLLLLLLLLSLSYVSLATRVRLSTKRWHTHTG